MILRGLLCCRVGLDIFSRSSTPSRLRSRSRGETYSRSSTPGLHDYTSAYYRSPTPTRSLYSGSSSPTKSDYSRGRNYQRNSPSTGWDSPSSLYRRQSPSPNPSRMHASRGRGYQRRSGLESPAYMRQSPSPTKLGLGSSYGGRSSPRRDVFSLRSEDRSGKYTTSHHVDTTRSQRNSSVTFSGDVSFYKSSETQAYGKSSGIQSSHGGLELYRATGDRRQTSSKYDESNTSRRRETAQDGLPSTKQTKQSLNKNIEALASGLFGSEKTLSSAYSDIPSVSKPVHLDEPASVQNSESKSEMMKLSTTSSTHADEKTTSINYSDQQSFDKNISTAETSSTGAAVAIEHSQTFSATETLMAVKSETNSINKTSAGSDKNSQQSVAKNTKTKSEHKVSTSQARLALNQKK